MAWVTPKTWTAGMVVSETDLNTHLRDNLNALFAPPFQQVVWTGLASTTASTAVPLDTANLSLTLNTNGGDVHVFFQAYQSNSTDSQFGLLWDGTAFNSGTALARSNEAGIVAFDVWVTGLASGSHTFRPMFWSTGGVQQVAINGTAGNAAAIFWAREG
jgi:hypothetical protein